MIPVFAPVTFFGSAPLVLTYIGRGVDATNSSTYTFTAQPIGTTAGDRLIIVEISGSLTATAVTLAGNAMSLAAGTASRTIWYLVVPTGTTADIIVTSSPSGQNCGISVYTLTGYTSATPFSTKDGGSALGNSAVDLSLNTTARSAVVATALITSPTNRTFIWSGLISDHDEALESGTATFSSASTVTTVASMPLAISVTPNGSATARSGVAACWA